MHEQPVEIQPSEAERVAYAYRTRARGDSWSALVRAIEDALTDLAASERAAQQETALISRGYVRGRLDAADR
ncbi:hypothetical protein U8607_24265 [Methylobacterium durans]|uniref:hypothetical protein n=1 Tax=Methylobacterium durans TaxID=2202825 RepID=UPI002AFEE9F0|nr:hypothetical protein [Methylobacterium durans]MEA1835205.1 hypothetical protein [Methylobacterium durans]